MAQSMGDYNKAQIKKYKTEKQTHRDFLYGTKVRVVVGCRDFAFFDEDEGVVVRSEGGYLGIQVKFKDFITHNFHPQDLFILKKGSGICPHCGK